MGEEEAEGVAAAALAGSGGGVAGAFEALISGATADFDNLNDV